MLVKTSLLDNSDGSAELVYGDENKVITSVNGPIEVKARQELPDSATLEIVIRPAVGVSSTRERLLEDKLRSLLQGVILTHQAPRQLIQVVVQFLVVDDSNAFTSSELNAAINSSFFALIDAHVPLSVSFVSTTFAIHNDEYIENPTVDQLKKSDSHHVICFAVENGEPERILLLEGQGKFSQSQVFTVVEKGSILCKKIHHEIQRKYLQEKLDRDYIWNT